MGLNGLGYDLLVDGVNEHGLACGGFYLPGYAGYQSVTPDQESQAIAPWELITWILTNFTNVDEVRAALPGIKVAGVPLGDKLGVPPLHYITHDAAGGSLVIEYVDGKLTTYDNPLGVITNSPTFDWHLTNLRNFINVSATNVPPLDLDGVTLSPFGQGSGLRGVPGDFTPPSRFVRAVALSEGAFPCATGEETVGLAFHVLDSFDIPRGVVRPEPGSNEPCEYTQWTSACDLKNLKYYYHTYDDRRVYAAELGKFDADAKRPVTIPFQKAAGAEIVPPPADAQ